MPPRRRGRGSNRGRGQRNFTDGSGGYGGGTQGRGGIDPRNLSAYLEWARNQQVDNPYGAMTGLVEGSDQWKNADINAILEKMITDPANVLASRGGTYDIGDIATTEDYLLMAQNPAALQQYLLQRMTLKDDEFADHAFGFDKLGELWQRHKGGQGGTKQEYINEVANIMRDTQNMGALEKKKYLFKELLGINEETFNKIKDQDVEAGITSIEGDDIANSFTIPGTQGSYLKAIIKENNYNEFSGKDFWDTTNRQLNLLEEGRGVFNDPNVSLTKLRENLGTIADKIGGVGEGGTLLGDITQFENQMGDLLADIGTFGGDTGYYGDIANLIANIETADVRGDFAEQVATYQGDISDLLKSAGVEVIHNDDGTTTFIDPYGNNIDQAEAISKYGYDPDIGESTGDFRKAELEESAIEGFYADITQKQSEIEQKGREQETARGQITGLEDFIAKSEDREKAEALKRNELQRQLQQSAAQRRAELLPQRRAYRYGKVTGAPVSDDPTKSYLAGVYGDVGAYGKGLEGILGAIEAEQLQQFNLGNQVTGLEDAISGLGLDITDLQGIIGDEFLGTGLYGDIAKGWNTFDELYDVAEYLEGTNSVADFQSKMEDYQEGGTQYNQMWGTIGGYQKDIADKLGDISGAWTDYEGWQSSGETTMNTINNLLYGAGSTYGNQQSASNILDTWGSSISDLLGAYGL